MKKKVNDTPFWFLFPDLFGFSFKIIQAIVYHVSRHTSVI